MDISERCLKVISRSWHPFKNILKWGFYIVTWFSFVKERKHHTVCIHWLADSNGLSLSRTIFSFRLMSHTILLIFSCFSAHWVGSRHRRGKVIFTNSSFLLQTLIYLLLLLLTTNYYYYISISRSSSLENWAQGSLQHFTECNLICTSQFKTS